MIKFNEKGKDNFKKSTALFGNLMMLIWIGLGTLAIWFYNPFFAWIFLASALIMVYIVLRKLVCTNCYYYDKICGLGWGKLSAKMFKKGDIEKFNNSIGIKIAPLTYGLITIVPVIVIIISIILVFNFYKLIVLILILLVSFYSGGIRRKYGCSKCKMSSFCKGSAVKHS